METRSDRQRGAFLIIVALFMLIVLAFMGVVFLTTFTTSTSSSLNELQSTRAFYVAEGGLERAVRLLTSPIIDTAGANPDRRRACSEVSTVLNNVSLSPGRFSVARDALSPYYPAAPATLTAAINATVNVIPVSADPLTAGYPAAGRIMVDRELMDYYGTTAVSFTNVFRGRGATTASAHAGGAPVGQYQCSVTSSGGVPDLAAPVAKRTLDLEIQLQEGWAVGGVGLPTATLNSAHCPDAANCWAVGDGGTIIRWNGTGWSETTSPTGQRLNEVHCTDANNCWAVGNKGGTAAERPLFLRWNGAIWAQYDSSAIDINSDLNSVHCVSANDCWAVGDQQGGNEVIFRWNGLAWSRVGPVAGIPNTDLNSVFCVSTNDCWAVGNDSGGEVTIRWTGGPNWTRVGPVAGIPNTELNSVFCVSTNNCWAVGDASGGDEIIIRWTGGPNWALVGPVAGISDEDLNSIACADANNCWAVGPDGGAGERPWIIRYNGVLPWSTYDTAAIDVATELNSVTCTGINDCWTVGDGGNIFHWDGATWTEWRQAAATALRFRQSAWNEASGMLPADVNLINSVSMLSYADGWAVGNVLGAASVAPCTPSRAGILRWNGSDWNCVASPSNQNLNSVYMVSSRDGYAVGNNGGGGAAPCTNGRILRWNTPAANAWSCIASPVNVDLRSVFMLDTNFDGTADDGWAVGNRQGCINPGPTLIRWTGAAWACPLNLPAAPDVNLNSVFMLSANDGWAVGASNGTRPAVLRWDTPCGGGALNGLWNDCTNAAYVPAQNSNLNSVYMVSSTDGWAVGNSTGTRPVVFRWNTNCDGTAGTVAWHNCTNAPYVPAVNQNLNSVYLPTAKDGWASGNGGLVLHWDGFTWSQVQPGLTVRNLQEIYVIGPKQRPQAAWQEVTK